MAGQDKPERTDTERRLAYRVPEAARALGISRSTAYELCAKGELPTIRLGTSIRVPIDALHAWIARQVSKREAVTDDSGMTNPLASLLVAALHDLRATQLEAARLLERLAGFPRKRHSPAPEPIGP